MFISVSTGEKNGKNRPRNARVVVENKVAPFSPGHCVYIHYKLMFTVSKHNVRFTVRIVSSVVMMHFCRIHKLISPDVITRSC